jgi:acyl transferase domain-containing protein
VTTTPLPDTERVAIIGMAGRFPKARDVEEYWRNLRDGVECISFAEPPDDEVLDSASADVTLVRAGGALEGLDLFDAPFFGVSARDAEAMDPQHRIFLECAWHSLEDAGYNSEACRALIGVFAGAGLSSYIADLYVNTRTLAALDDYQIAIGNDKDHLTTQVAYKLGLQGPSVTVQTACSTSLVAVCMACQSLLDYQCDVALAGGVAVDINTAGGYYYQRGGILSPDGHCRAFDAAAEGTVPGDGVGVVVLKRFSEAIADRDAIRAVIAGFAVNNDGNRKVGYTAPSVDGQAEVIAMAHASAGVDPTTITYLEAHGTGTPLGDPIEIAALNQVFRAAGGEHGYCALGSVKSNVGHLDTAAGVAGLIKTVLALEHRSIPPSLHFVRPNPEIDFADSPFRVNTELTEWCPDRGPRRAGVSSFGIGGTNAHVVLEEAPPIESSAQQRPVALVTISARTGTALETATDNLARHLAEHPELPLGDVAYTSHVGRKAFSHRRVLTVKADASGEAGAALQSRDPARVHSRQCRAQNRPVFFLFPGQGTQSVDMAAELYRHEPCFRAEVDRCADILRGPLERDLRELLFPTAKRRAEAAHLLGRTAFTQPALFTIEYSLARLWLDWGVRPAAMLGHSIGEWVAACLAEVVPLGDALELVALRGRAMEQLPPGAMLAVNLSQTAVEQYLTDEVSLAAVNGVTSCVVSGPSEAIDRVAAELTSRGTPAHRLATSHAFHSAMMQPAVGQFVDAVRGVPLQPPCIPFVSNVTGTWITPSEATDPHYWGRQLRETVRFSDGLHELFDSPDAVLLEVGPMNTIANLVRQHPSRSAGQAVISSLPPAPETGDDLESVIAATGELWLHGVELNWASFHAAEECGRVSLPPYPFERRRYWSEPSVEGDEPEADSDGYAEEAHDWFSFPGFKPAPPSVDDGASREPRRWLVLGDSAPLSAQLTGALRSAGEDVVEILRGEEFAVLGEATYAVRPDQASDYEQLLAQLGERRGPIDAIVHLWSAGAADGDPLDREAFSRHQDVGFNSLVALVQGLDRLQVSTPVELNVVTAGIYPVIGHEALWPARATIAGPCRVIPQEYPNLACRLIDVEAAPDADRAARLGETLVAELIREAFEPTVAYRNGRRWLPSFDPAYLDPEADPLRTYPGGAYLITGGLGNIGAVIARFLARTTPKVKLILTGRSAPPAQDGSNGSSGGESAVNDARIALLRELESEGAEVAYFSADVADRAQMARVIEESEDRFGTIRGVIHGAGDVEAYFPINELTPEAVQRQFRPKVEGLMVLDELMSGHELDFCVLQSSLSAFVGGVGLAGYAASNCFLDAMAGYRNQRAGSPWISINWGAWHFPAGDGVDADPGVDGDAGISPAGGEDAFEVILGRAPRQILVSPWDLASLYEEAVIEQSVAAAVGDRDVAAVQHSRPELSTAYSGPRDPAEAQLAEIWQELLGVTPIGVFDSFFELGGHSLLAIQLISRVRTAFGVDVSVRRIFESPTIAELAAGLTGEPPVTAEDQEPNGRPGELVESFADQGGES